MWSARAARLPLSALRAVMAEEMLGFAQQIPVWLLVMQMELASATQGFVRKSFFEINSDLPIQKIGCVEGTSPELRVLLVEACRVGSFWLSASSLMQFCVLAFARPKRRPLVLVLSELLLNLTRPLQSRSSLNFSLLLCRVFTDIYCRPRQ